MMKKHAYRFLIFLIFLIFVTFGIRFKINNSKTPKNSEVARLVKFDENLLTNSEHALKTEIFRYGDGSTGIELTDIYGNKTQFVIIEKQQLLTKEAWVFVGSLNYKNSKSVEIKEPKQRQRTLKYLKKIEGEVMDCF